MLHCFPFKTCLVGGEEGVAAKNSQEVATEEPTTIHNTYTQCNQQQHWHSAMLRCHNGNIQQNAVVAYRHYQTLGNYKLQKYL